MSRLEYYQGIIQERVQRTSFRDFIKQVVSWYPVNFYKRGGLISVYPETRRSPNIVSPEEFGTSIESLLEYGIPYEPRISFFENYAKLFHSVPFSALRQFPIVENSEYTDSSGWGTHNCYLDIGLYDVENVCYSFEVKENCRNIFNSVMVWNNCENVYQSNCIVRSSFVFYSRFILESSNIWFSTNLIGCHDCIFCDGISNASYAIRNITYSREEYEAIQEKMLRDQQGFERYYRGLSTDGENLVSTNTSGTYITNSRNVENGYYSYNITEGKNIVLVGSDGGNNHMYNVISSGSPFFDHGYNVINSGGGNHMYCSDFIVGSNIYYSYFLENCTFCLGCIGLKNKSYCILNIEYSKEEWYDQVEKIFAAMEDDGSLGAFFPATLNPFYYNDTAASMFDPSASKEMVENEGYLWRDEPIRVDIPEGLEVVKSSELDRFQGFTSPQPSPEGEGVNNNSPSLKEKGPGDEDWYIDPAILEKVIVDEKGNSYRIVKMEYDFLMKHGLPLPTTHWLDRIKSGFCFNS